MEHRPKILFVLHLPPPVHGAAMVGKYIHDSKLINEKFECRYINLTTASSLEDIGKLSLSKLKTFVRLVCHIRREVKAFRPQLVYITPNAKGGAFYKDFIVVEMLKMMGCRIVAHYHNKGVSTHQEQWLDNLLYKRFFKGIKVILLGKSLYKDVEKYVKWEDVYICPNGIPVTTAPLPEKTLNPIPRLLFLSNLLESKGVFVLLDALKMLKDEGYTFICDFVGGETAEIDVNRFQEEVHQRGLDGTCLYQGKKYGKDKDEAYRQADFFVFPTYNECFPLVLLEAMQHRLPCISTNEGAIMDIVDDGVTGYVVGARNADHLAAKIEVLLNDNQQRMDMGENGYRKYQEQFTLDVFEKRMHDVLVQLM